LPPVCVPMRSAFSPSVIACAKSVKWPLLCNAKLSTLVHLGDRLSRMNCSAFAMVSSTIHTSGS
jgi:hypothetical protein